MNVPAQDNAIGRSGRIVLGGMGERKRPHAQRSRVPGKGRLPVAQHMPIVISRNDADAHRPQLFTPSFECVDIVLGGVQCRVQKISQYEELRRAGLTKQRSDTLPVAIIGTGRYGEPMIAEDSRLAEMDIRHQQRILRRPQQRPGPAASRVSPGQA